MHSSPVVFTILLAATTIGGSPAVRSVYNVVPERSRALIKVGKSGAFSFLAGHSHEVLAPIRGSMTIDPAHVEASAVTFAIETADLTVNAEGEPLQDVPKIQASMAGPGVLDIARYPTIRFRSTSITTRAQRDRIVELTATGELTLHGVTKLITVPVRAELGSGTICAEGTFPLKQSDFGIQRPSVAGLVSVRDQIEIHVTIVASAQP